MHYDLDDLWHRAVMIISACDEINQRINEIGEIPKSDQTIKNWHSWDNAAWQLLLEAVLIIDECYPVDQHLVKDVHTLLDHLDRYSDYTDNLLYPEPKVTNQLSKKLTTVTNYWGRSENVKTVTFRSMMRIRELYCKITGLDLPNEHTSQGRLDGKPIDRLFEF